MYSARAIYSADCSKARSKKGDAPARTTISALVGIEMNGPEAMAGHVRSHLEQTALIARATAEAAEELAQMACRLIACLQAGNKILLCGNGGSAADAMHVATELLARYKAARRALPAIALGTDVTFLTAMSNDFDFSLVFARQIEGLANPGDVLWAFSTSGNSASVIKAVDKSRDLGLYSIGFTGEAGGRLAEVSDLCLRVPSADTPHIQEIHMAAAHVICDLIERAFID